MGLGWRCRASQQGEDPSPLVGLDGQKFSCLGGWAAALSTLRFSAPARGPAGTSVAGVNPPFERQALAVGSDTVPHEQRGLPDGKRCLELRHWRHNENSHRRRLSFGGI